MRFQQSQQAVDRALAAADRETAAALAAAEKAVDKAEAAANEWRKSANEWRGAMTDRERNFLPRREFYVIVGTMAVVIGLGVSILSILRPI